LVHRVTQTLYQKHGVIVNTTIPHIWYHIDLLVELYLNIVTCVLLTLCMKMLVDEPAQGKGSLITNTNHRHFEPSIHGPGMEHGHTQ